MLWLIFLCVRHREWRGVSEEVCLSRNRHWCHSPPFKFAFKQANKNLWSRQIFQISYCDLLPIWENIVLFLDVFQIQTKEQRYILYGCNQYKLLSRSCAVCNYILLFWRAASLPNLTESHDPDKTMGNKRCPQL